MLRNFKIYNAFLVLSDGLASQLMAGQAMNSDEEKEVEHRELWGWTFFMVATWNFKENILQCCTLPSIFYAILITEQTNTLYSELSPVYNYPLPVFCPSWVIYQWVCTNHKEKLQIYNFVHIIKSITH